MGARTVNYSGPLPVEQVAFEAKALNAGAALTWRTAQEKNNHHFEVERSTDGAHFVAIATVAGHGTTTQPHGYEATDAGCAHLARLLYYRLRQVDTDGTVSLSPVRTVQFAEVTAPAAGLYPNPTTGMVKLDLMALPDGTYAVTMMNATGQTWPAQQLAAGQQHELNLSALPAGMYVVRVTGGAVHQVIRLVKE